MTPLILRAATSADAPAVADVYLASRKAFLPFAPLAHSDSDVRQWIVDRLIPGEQVTLAVSNQEVVGMMAMVQGGSESWINQLYVLPEAVGRGIGSALLRHALLKLEPPIRLYTFQANAGARRFYERHGFRAIAFGDGTANEERRPDVLYELSLEGQVKA